MRFCKLLAAIRVVAAVSTTALAVVVEREWTPDDMKNNPGEFRYPPKWETTASSTLK